MSASLTPATQALPQNELTRLCQGKKLVMCGCHQVGRDLITQLLKAGVRFDYFVCLSPEQGQKYQVSGYEDLSTLAHEYDIPVYVPENYALTGPRDIAFFEEHAFDLLIQGGWQRLYPEHVLNRLSIGAIGVHGSADFLPKGRGRSPLNWSLIEGKERFILHLFLIRPGADDGDVFAYQMFDITPFDDIKTLYYKVSIATRQMILAHLPRLLRGDIEPTPQAGEPSYYPKRTAADGKIDWETMDVWQIHNFIRAQTRPYPGAFAEIDGTTYTLWQAQVFDTRISYPGVAYGEVVERFGPQGNEWVVNCRGGLLLITQWEASAFS